MRVHFACASRWLPGRISEILLAWELWSRFSLRLYSWGWGVDIPAVFVLSVQPRQDNPIQCIFCQKTPVQLPHCTCFQLRLCKVWYCSKITASCLTLYFSAPWRATGRLRVVYASKKSWKSSNPHTASHIFIHLHTHLPFPLVHPAAVNTAFNNSYMLEGFNVSVFVLVL